MKEYEILTRSLKDSAANSKLKLLKDGETFGVEKPGGEKRIHIGSMSEEKEWDRFFFPNGGQTFNVVVSKIDLIKYMIEAKSEYLNPHQSYRLNISDYYDTLYDQTLRIPQESFEICFEKNTDNSRYYLTRPTNNNLSKNYNYIIDICLPIVTKYVFLRVKNGASYVFYLKPEFRPDYINPNLIDNDSKFDNNLQQILSDYRPFITAIKTKPFLILGGFSGTGKSQKVKELAFMTCPNDELMRLRLGNTDNTPGNYCLVSIRPNWHDSSDLLGYYSSINDKYIVTDFVRFLVKAMQYEDIPFFVCLDEMNLAPVEEYFAEFLSVLESRKKVGDKILTDPLLTADWFNKKYKEYNIFDDLGLRRIGKEQSVKENQQAGLFTEVDEMPFDRMDIVEDLKKNGLRLPQNIIVIGTVNMDDTTNSFSRKVIDRAMTFETIVEKFGPEYYTAADTMTYRGKVRGNWTWILPDEVKASEALMHKPDLLRDEEKTEITNYINEVNACLKGSPFQIAYRILNETILYYRALWVVNHGDVELGQVFDDILMQKVLPRIEGDFDKTYKPLSELKTLAERRGWKKSQEKIDFMLGRFNKDDQGGFTSFWN